MSISRGERDNEVNELRTQLATQAEVIRVAKEALEFYAANEGLFIDFQNNMFKSRDSDDKDFHGALAREALARIAEMEK